MSGKTVQAGASQPVAVTKTFVAKVYPTSGAAAEDINIKKDGGYLVWQEIDDPDNLNHPSELFNSLQIAAFRGGEWVQYIHGDVGYHRGWKAPQHNRTQAVVAGTESGATSAR